MSKNKRAVIALVIIVVMIVAVILCVTLVNNSGKKTITVDVTHLDGTTNTFTIKTKEEFLRGALDQENLIEGTDSDFGLWVTAVDGETADDAKEQWWGFTKSGEYVDTGVDSTPIADGDHFEFTLNTGYDF